MSLYTLEEICKGCCYAIFHECCNKFCKCGIKNEIYVDYNTGACYQKNIPNPITYCIENPNK